MRRREKRGIAARIVLGVIIVLRRRRWIVGEECILDGSWTLEMNVCGGVVHGPSMLLRLLVAWVRTYLLHFFYIQVYV